jgi:hypothetical protein
MKLFAAAALVLGMTVTAFAGEIIVPVKDKVEVSTDTIVRITGEGIAGSEIKVTVTGPGKVDSTNSIIPRAGKNNMVGNTTEEFNIKATGKGKIKVVVSVKSPTAPKPVEKEYEIDVK